MEVLEIIAENIEAKDQNNVLKVLKHYLENVKNKSLFGPFIVNLFSQHYISKNLWLLKEFAKELLSIETNKLNPLAYQNICLLLINSEFKKLEMFEKDKIYDYDIQIEKYLQGFLKEYEDLRDFKDELTDECFALCNILYKNILQSNSLSNCFIILRYLLTRKKRELFINSNSKLCIIDYIFMILMKFLNLNNTSIGKNIRIGEDVYEYVILCKDIYYYNCKQKDKTDKNRINLLFYSIFVLVNRKVKYQEIRYQIIENEPVKYPKNVDYLYVLIKYNPQVINIVNNDKVMSKLSIKAKKTINVEGDFLSEREKCNLNIIKI
jgi:hypothetical protein